MRSHTSASFTYLVVGFASALTAIIMVLGFQATADQNGAIDQVPRQIPYSGVLKLDGEPVTAEAMLLRFELRDRGGDGQLWFRQDIQTNIYAGKFSVMLGPGSRETTLRALEEAISYANDYALIITVLNNPDTPDDDVRLNNAQRLVMAPGAVWASHATNFDVANTLTANTSDHFEIQTSNLSSPFGSLQLGFDAGPNRITLGTMRSAFYRGVLGVDANGSNGGAAPLLKMNAFTVDSEGTSLANLVAGAYATGDNAHNYFGTQGASRIALGDGTVSMWTGAGANAGHAAGDAVSWSRALHITQTDTTIDKGFNKQTVSRILTEASGPLALEEETLFGPFNVQPGEQVIATTTGSGDPDLYVRFDQLPTASEFDCRSWIQGPDELCSLTVPNGATTVYVMMRGFTVSTYNLTVTSQAANSSPMQLGANIGGFQGQFIGGLLADQLQIEQALTVTGGFTITNNLSVLANTDLANAQFNNASTWANPAGVVFNGNSSYGNEMNFPNEVYFSGGLNSGFYIKTCETNSVPYDCLCNDHEMVLGGGGYGRAVAETLDESRPVKIGNRMGWRLASTRVDGAGQGDRAFPRRSYVICMDIGGADYSFSIP